MEHQSGGGGRTLRDAVGGVRPLSVNRLIVERTVHISQSDVQRHRPPIAQRDTRKGLEVGAAGFIRNDVFRGAGHEGAFEVEIRHRAHKPAHIAHGAQFEAEGRHLRVEKLVGTVAAQIFGVDREERGRRNRLVSRNLLDFTVFLGEK